MLPLEKSLVSHNAAISILRLFSSLSMIVVFLASEGPGYIFLTFHVVSRRVGGLQGFLVVLRGVILAVCFSVRDYRANSNEVNFGYTNSDTMHITQPSA